MHTSRRMACVLLAANTAAWAQTPANPDPPQPGPPPGEQAPVPAQSPLQQWPHQGNLPNAPSSAASSLFANLPTATIREFRSSVSEITPRGATDMFIAALVQTRRFRVLERSRLAEGAAAEKALNQQGMTTGAAGQSQYIAATYSFEATISESSTDDRRSGFSLGLGAALAGQGTSTDSIAIDVRMVDVESGVVVEAVTVRKEIKSVKTNVSGVTSTLLGLFGKGSAAAAAQALSPTDEYYNARKDSVDKSLRDAIKEAVLEIAKRLVNE
jgi:curli biogenesis system outer membrane secretion channel CsgG